MKGSPWWFHFGSVSSDVLLPAARHQPAVWANPWMDAEHEKAGKLGNLPAKSAIYVVMKVA
ncbi:hypothetical protein [Rhizobium mayense]|uniref:Uncharacterized protein n=1 Tax=Rhizobium mayense TaxID=1312184 RepID=A0ABT7JLQ5_9HYPH|nr:hypothetical protein [Rhizobium mayense]MDL2397276.1 hypothetical protein [Rhizobium mayense]